MNLPTQQECLDSTITVRIKPGYEGAGCEGILLAHVFVEQLWAVVLFDNEEDPTTFKMGALEIQTTRWEQIGI